MTPEAAAPAPGFQHDAQARHDNDAQARHAALHAAGSVLVRAPAGSGKTGLLVQRFLRLLAEVETPEAILALTFTRKAAGEMRQRVLQAIAAADGAPPAAAHDRLTWELARAARDQDARHSWQLARSPSRLQIMTLDSLALKLAGRMPWLTRLGPAPRPTEDADRLYRAASRATMSRIDLAGDDPSPGGAAARALLRHLNADLEAAETLLAELLARRDAWLPLVLSGASQEQFEANLRQVLQAQFDDVREKLRAEGVPVTVAGLDVAGWQALAAQLLTKEGTARKKGPYPRLGDAACAALHRTRSLPEPAYSEYEWNIIATLVRLLPVAAAELRVVFAEHGECDFTEITLAARAALGTLEAPSALAYGLDAQLQHIFIDEFQDTSRAQYGLICGLISDWTAGDGRTLFLVGDPMQSIFGFRDAEVELFEQAEARGHLGGQPLQRLQLRRNFRSGWALAAWVGGHFEIASEGVNSGGEAFVDAIASRNPRAEAAEVARLVQQEIAAGAGTVAILVQSRTHVAPIHHALRRAGVAYSGSKLMKLADSPVVLDLMALTRALHDPADRVAWLAVLRAPWCGLTLADLHALCGGDRETAVTDLWRQRRAHLSGDGGARAARTMTVLEAAAQQRGRWSPRALVEWCWRELDGAGCTFHPAGAAAFFERLDHASGWDAAALRAALEGLFAPDEHAPQGRVQIMTVHQAKGLEFDAVILPGLGRRLRPDKDGLLRWAEFPADVDFAWLMAPRPARGTEERTVYGLIKQRDQEKKRQEQRRLLYVGMTRARHRLHLVSAMPLHPSTGQLRAPDGGTPLACVWATLQPEFERQFQQHRSQAGLAAHEALSSTLAPAAGFPLLRRVRVVPAAAVAPAPAAATVSLQNLQGALAPGGWERGTGTAVHALLRRLAESGVRSWSAAHLDHQLRSAGVLPADLPRARERAERALRHTLDDARGRWILDRHPGARCEWAIAGATPGGAAHRVIDRSFIAADGTHWIIDYKITEPGPGAQAAAWLEAERERYQPQLAAYAQLVAALHAEPRPWRCGLYFPLTGAWLEWGG